jgi:hypothetical protein
MPLHDRPLLIGGLRSGSGGVDVLFGMLPDTCDFHFYPCELIATADASTLRSLVGKTSSGYPMEGLLWKLGPV